MIQFDIIKKMNQYWKSIYENQKKKCFLKARQELKNKSLIGREMKMVIA